MLYRSSSREEEFVFERFLDEKYSSMYLPFSGTGMGERGLNPATGWSSSDAAAELLLEPPLLVKRCSCRQGLVDTLVSLDGTKSLA